MYKDFTIKSGKIQDAVSLFSPDEKTKNATALVLHDYQNASESQRRARREFNNRSLLQEIDVMQRAFNSYIPPKSIDPDEEWRAQTVRPLTRNKLISIAAHVTSSVLYPNVFAQNSNDDEDKDAALVMRDLIEYNINNSNYSKSFLQAVITMLVDPACILESEFAEVMRTVKKMNADGTWTEKEILDEVFSGFAAYVVPAKNLLIANFYETDIQKQRFVIKNRYIDYNEAKQIYGKHENFKFVKPGYRTVFDVINRVFYDIQDDEMMNYLVNEVTYYNRALDLKLVFISGILVCDPETPNPREDKLYPFAKSGYEPLNNGQFFYYKSAANKLGSDQEIVDNLYNMILDGTYMQLMPPLAVYGSEDIGSSVMIPGTTTSFRDPNVKVENIGPKSDVRAGMEAIAMVEKSMSESSQDALQSGVAQGGQRTAREAILLQQNAKTALGLFGKQIAFLVEDFGNLMVGDILQHMTVAQVDALTNEMKYKAFLLPDKLEGGKKVTRKIDFSADMLGSEGLTEEEKLSKSYDLLEKEGGMDSGVRITKVNPELFRNTKYKITVSADELTPKSKMLEKAILLEGYDRAIQNPVADQEAVTRDFLFEALKPGESDKYIRKTQGSVPPGMESLGGFQQKGVSTSMLSQVTGSNSLGIAANSDLNQE